MSIRWSFNAASWEPSAAQLSIISGIIQPEEKARIARFVFMRDAKSAVIGRLLIRKLIQIKTRIPNDRIQLGRDDHNKPILISPCLSNEGILDLPGDLIDPNSNSPELSPSLASLNLNFNISHQGSYVVLASDPAASLIGIDVMNVDKPGRIADSVDEYFRLMNRQFTEAEWRQIKGLDGVGRLSDRKKMSNFTRFWCLKEAYVKAIGVGIVIDLKTIDFQTKTDSSGVGVVASDTTVRVDGVLETEWEFEERSLDETHLVAVAKKLEDKDKPSSEVIPDFEEVCLDFLLENMTPLAEEDGGWVDKFLGKNKRK